MRVMIYSAPNVMARALAQGLEGRGHRACFREARLWRGEVEPCDLLIVKGRNRDDIKQAYGKPALVLDWGYVDRVNTPAEHELGHWQLAYGRLNAIPPFECPPDRLKKLGITFKQSGGNPKGYVLLIGQLLKDTAVMSYHHQTWLKEQVNHYGASEIRYRRHPRGGVPLRGVTELGGSLQDALDGARLVVTFNSNTGHEALIAGVPVVCTDPHATYAPMCGEKIPSVKDRREFYQRVAYGQWKHTEAQEALDFVLDRLLPHYDGALQ